MDAKFWKRALKEAERELDAATKLADLNAAAKQADARQRGAGAARSDGMPVGGPKMRPENVLSPRDRLEPGSLEVIYTSANGRWSVTEMVYDGAPRVGCRWNGAIDDEEDKGNPCSHGQATWFVLPNEIGPPLAELIKGLQQGG